MLSSLLSAKAAAAAVAAVALGGAASAAYAGALPAPAQKLAHDTIGAPSPHPSGSPGAHATPVGPDATGPAAFGLCTAYKHAMVHGTAAQKSVAFRNLAAAAGGSANVTAYCATVAHPGASGKPASLPSMVPTSHPSGQPSSHPGGQPSSLPTGAVPSHPSGQPSSQPTAHSTKAAG